MQIFMTARRLQTWLATVLACLLGFQGGPVLAWQQPGSPPKLLIEVVEGDGAAHAIGRPAAATLKVVVRDENGAVVAGAAVTFTVVPGPEGASGTFEGQASLRAQTNRSGEAIAPGLQPNQTPGEFRIRAEAAYLDKTGFATLTQKNELTGIDQLRVKALGGPYKNNAARGMIAAPIVVVTDEEGRPIQGASVECALPAHFSEGSATSNAVTAANGQAICKGLSPNQKSGKYNLTVTASLATLPPAKTEIPMENAGHFPWWVLVVLAAGGGGGAAYAQSARKGSTGAAATGTPPAQTTVLTPGTPVFVPPR